MDIMLIKEFIWGIGKILSDRKMIVTILAISIIFGSSISQFEGFAEAKDDESPIERVNFESCCCCATNIFKTESDGKEMSDLEKQVKAKAQDERGRYGIDKNGEYRKFFIVCIYEKATKKICCSDGKTVKCCRAISGDGKELDSTIENKGPIPTGKWLIGEKRPNRNRTWFDLLRVTKGDVGGEEYLPYNGWITEYNNRCCFGLHSGEESKGCIVVTINSTENREGKGLVDDHLPKNPAKVTMCWHRLANMIFGGNLSIGGEKFHGYLYAQYLYEEVESKFENTIISNSIVDLVITRDDQGSITSSPPSLFKRGNNQPADLIELKTYPNEEKNPNNGKPTGTGDIKKYPYRWRYRITKKGEHKIKDFILDNVPDNPWETENWGNWVASNGWNLTKIEKNDNGKWKITWETETPVDAAMVGFDHRFELDPKYPKGKCEVSFDGIKNEWGEIYVPLDEPPTVEKLPLTGVYSTYNLLPDNVIEMNVRVVGGFYSDKIYGIEIFPEAQNPPWYGVDAIEAPEGWSYEKIGNGIRFFTLTDPLIKCQPRKFIFRIWGIRISRYIEVHITDKNHENLGVIMSTWWQLKKVYRH